MTDPTGKDLLEMIGQLERRIDTHEGRLEALAGVSATLQAIDRRLWENDRAMIDLGKKMDTNTAITESIRDAQIAGRVLNNAAKWLGGMILLGAGAWAAIKGFRLP